MSRKKCIHNIRKEYCKNCGGSQLCIHNKRKSRCKECEGGELCKHNRMKIYCIECGGSQICIHNRRKYVCKECNGTGICEHNTIKEQCNNCKGNRICIHNRLKSNCIECHGSQICIHDKRKSRCKECGGTSLCKSEWCETRVTNKYNGYCLNCFISIFPDMPNSRNYKTKEQAVVDFIYQCFPLDKYTWISDKQIKDGCSKRRPDLFLDLGYQVIIIEIDENQHINYDCTCENKRLMLLSQDINHRPLIYIRFNPDEYISNIGKITSCWGINGYGICTIKKTKQAEWNKRLEFLKEQITYWCKLDSITNKTIQVIELYYDSN